MRNSSRIGPWMRYAIVIERGPTSYGAYVPDLPGCVVAAESREEALQLIGEAIELHIEGMREEGFPIPDPSSSAEYVEIQWPNRNA
jgi:predicted RNase H-like HicB family nuclease